MNNRKIPEYKQRFLRDLQEGLQDSVSNLSNENKSIRESWVVQRFLENLEIQFFEKEVDTPLKVEPYDVIFRDARFQIKEILDLGRRKDHEFKELRRKSLTIEDPIELLGPYTFINDLTPQDIIQLIEAKLEKLETKYAPAVRAKLDLLFYINLIHNTLKIDKMPDPQNLARFGYRSISALFGWASVVYCASDTAPSFLLEKHNQLIVMPF
jgi:hypothetical protein